MKVVDVVVVSYNSRRHLRACVEHLASHTDIRIIVVDNASTDRSLETVVDLPIEFHPLDVNDGFAVGCNVGWRAGAAPYVLFLNPDAQIDESALRELVATLESSPDIGIVGPKTLDRTGSLLLSRRRFPRLRSTYARALFLHRLFPRVASMDECLANAVDYERRGQVEWISGSCMLVRRSLLEQIGGLDEGFFLYYEDTDLCRQAWDAGFTVEYDPHAICVHVGGASAPRAALLPVAARSAIRYARKHNRRRALLFRIGLALEEALRTLVSESGMPGRNGHARAFLTLVAAEADPPNAEQPAAASVRLGGDDNEGTIG
jgi:N-acetylglucosaminyl-diphospho-decaprenol L-rhamnosyltransferase